MAKLATPGIVLLSLAIGIILFIFLFLLIGSDRYAYCKIRWDDLDEIKASLLKGIQYPIAELLELDDKYRKLQKQEQYLRTKRNKGSEEVSKIKKSGKEAGSEKVKELADIRNQVEELEKQRIRVRAENPFHPMEHAKCTR